MFPQFCDFDSPALGGFLTYSLLTNVLSGSDDGSTTRASAQTSLRASPRDLAGLLTRKRLSHTRQRFPSSPAPASHPASCFSPVS